MTVDTYMEADATDHAHGLAHTEVLEEAIGALLLEEEARTP